MHKTDQLVELLEKQLCRTGNQSDLSIQDLDNVYKAAKTIYYIQVTKAMEEGQEMSRDYLGNSGDMDYLRNEHRMSNRSYMNRSYSRNDEKSAMVEALEDMMYSAPTNSEKETIQRCVNKLRNL